MSSARLTPRTAAVGLVASLLGAALWWLAEAPAPAERSIMAQGQTAHEDEAVAELAVRSVPDASTVETPDWMPAELRVVVRTEQREPVAHARVESDCGWAARTDSAGEWVQLLPAGTCSVWASREDGLLRVISTPQQMRLEAGSLVEVSLLLPSEPQGGIGVAVEPHVDGVRVRALRPNAPATEAGLVPGAVVVEVDGRSTGDWQAEDFADAVIGPLGTTVVLTLQAADTGGDVEVSLIRTWLSPGAPSGGEGGLSLASLSDEQRREVAAIREALDAMDDGSGLDLETPRVQELVDRVAAIADAAH